MVGRYERALLLNIALSLVNNLQLTFFIDLSTFREALVTVRKAAIRGSGWYLDNTECKGTI